jgi:hypothetical protein
MTSNTSSPPSELASTPLFIDAVSYGEVAKCPREIRVQ